MTAKVFLKIILCFAYLKEHAEDTTVKLRAAYQEEYVIGDRGTSKGRGIPGLIVSCLFPRRRAASNYMEMFCGGVKGLGFPLFPEIGNYIRFLCTTEQTNFGKFPSKRRCAKFNNPPSRLQKTKTTKVKLPFIVTQTH